MNGDNLIFFGTWHELPIGAVIKVVLRERSSEELQFTMVKIVREATEEEYLDYCESISIALRAEVKQWIKHNKKIIHPNWGAHYYAGLGD